jgi:O-antigen/teichoic acid export membrane protein
MLARSVTLNVAGNVASLVIGFVGSIVLARALGPTDRGVLALLQSVSTFALTLTAMGLPMAVLYYASRRERSTRRLLGTSLWYAAGLTAVLVPLAWLGRAELADVFAKGRGGSSWLLAAALVPLTFLDWTTHNQILAKLRFGLFNALSIAGKLLTLALTVLLVARLGWGVAGGLVAIASASLVMVAGCLPPLVREGRPRFDRRLLGTMTRYGAKVQIGVIFGAVNYRLDVVILQFFRPLSAVGYYVIAQVIAELVIVLANSFQSSVIPLVARSEGADRQRTTLLSIRHHGILAAAACVANAGFGTLLILFAYGRAYHAALVPMLTILPGIWFLGTGSVVTSDLRGRGRPGLASAVSGLAVALTVGLDLALIPPFGVEGAAVASLVTYTAFGIASLVTLSREVGVDVRTLVVPRRADLAAYPAFARALMRRVRAPRAAVLPENPA